MSPKTFAEGTELEDLQLLRFVGPMADLEFWEGARWSPDGSLTRLSLKLAARGARADVPRRLQREIALAGGLAHPGILRLLGHARPHGIDVVLAEPIDGPSVSAVQAATGERRQRLPAFAVVQLLERVARALAHAWEARDPVGRPLRIVHRALSPSRIFVGSGGRAVLADWSTAGTALEPPPPVPAWTLEEARFAAPELDGDPEASGPAADMFAFGVLAWELACSSPFVQGTEVGEIRSRLQRLKLERRVGAVPSGLVGLGTLLDRLLRRDPSRRLPDPSDLLAAVREVARQTPPGMTLDRVVTALSGYRPPIATPPRAATPSVDEPVMEPATQDWTSIPMDEIRAAHARASRPATEDWTAVPMEEIRAAQARMMPPTTEDWSALSMTEIRAAKERAEARLATQDWSAIPMEEIRAARERARNEDSE